MHRSTRTLALTLLVGLLAAGCNFAQEPEATPTISPDQVLLTAEAIAAATLQAITPTKPPTPVPPAETPILETATPEATATPGSPVLVAEYNANVRFGPGEEYPVIGYLLAGDTADVIGRRDDTPIGIWWYFQRPDVGQKGWIWSGAVEVSGNTAGVPVLEKPPTPTPTKGPTKTPKPTETTEAAPSDTPGT